MNKKIEFSVVIPAYNRAHLIGRALKSVGEQTHKAHEIIVIDDGSIDDIAGVVERTGLPIRLLRQENSGAASARNLGIQHAAADWIAFLDSDDYWEDDHLAELSTLIARWPNAGIAYCGYAVIGCEQKRRKTENTSFEMRLTSYTEKDGPKLGAVSTSACAIRRSLLLEMGGFPRYRCGEDTVVMFDIGTRFPLASSTRITSYYVRHGFGIMDTEKLVPGEDDVNAMLGQLVARLDDDGARNNASVFVDSRIWSKIKAAILGLNRAYVLSNYKYLKSPFKRWIIRIFLLFPDFFWKSFLHFRVMFNRVKGFRFEGVHEK